MTAHTSSPSPGEFVGDRPAWLAERALLLSVALLAVAWCFRDDAQPDLYFHLACGAEVLRHGWPSANVFLAPHPEHPFVAHQWGFQVLAYLTWSWLGPAGLTLLKTLLVGGTLALVGLAVRGQGASGRWFVLGLAVLLMGERFLTRPELLSFLGVALHLALLAPAGANLAGGRWTGRSLLILLGFQLLWSNGHGHVSLLGPAVTGCFLGGALVRRAWSAPWAGRPQPLGALAGLFAAELVIAWLLNPYGLAAVLFPFSLAQRALAALGPAGSGAAGPELPLAQATIVEFTSPLAPALAGRFMIVLWKAWVLLAVPLTCLALWRRRLRPGAVLAAVFLVAISGVYVRTLPFAALGLALPTAAGLRVVVEDAGARWPSLRSPSAATAAGVLLTLGALFLARATLADRFHENSDYDARPGLGIAPFLRYEQALEFWRQDPPRGDLFNNFGAGHYLTWSRARDAELSDVLPKPFISGNLDLYPLAHYHRYRELLLLQGPAAPRPRRPLLERFTAELDALEITEVFLDHRVETPPLLIGALAASRDWSLVHADPRCVIFRRSRAESTTPGIDPGTVARRAERWGFADEQEPSGLLVLLQGAGLAPARPGRPLERLHSARLLLTLGQPARAWSLAEQALKRDDTFPPILAGVADVAQRSGAVDQAERLFRQLIELDPAAAGPHLGQARLALGRRDLPPAKAAARAAVSYRRAISLAPADPVSHLGLLEAEDRAGDAVGLRRALAGARAALPAAQLPASRAAFYEGAAAWHEDDYERAAELLGRCVAAEPANAAALQLWGAALLQRGELEGAAQAFRRLVDLDPRDASAWRQLGDATVLGGELQRALELYERAAEVDPREWQALYKAALVAWRELGDPRRARSYLQLAEARAPGNQPVRNLLKVLGN